MAEIVSSIGVDESAGLLLGDSDENNRSAAEIQYDFAFQKICAMEEELFNAIRSGVMADNADLVVDFADFYNQQTPSGREKLEIIRGRIRDLLRFEAVQGSEKAAELLTLIER